MRNAFLNAFWKFRLRVIVISNHLGGKHDRENR